MSYFGKFRGRLGPASKDQPLKTVKDIGKFKNQVWASIKVTDSYVNQVECTFLSSSKSRYSKRLAQVSRALLVDAKTS